MAQPDVLGRLPQMKPPIMSVAKPAMRKTNSVPDRMHIPIAIFVSPCNIKTNAAMNVRVRMPVREKGPANHLQQRETCPSKDDRRIP